MAGNTNLSPEDELMKTTQGDKQKKEALEEIFAHLDDIMNNADRMTSGNFMHHRAAIKLSAKIVKDRVAFLNSKQEVPSNNSINFEEELYKAFGQVKDFSLGMRIAARFYDMGRFDAHIQNDDHVVYNEELGCRVNLSQLKRVAKKGFTFKAIPRLLEMIEPTDRAKAYTTRLADALEKEGYTTDAKLARESIKVMNGKKVAMATMDEEPVSDGCNPYKVTVESILEMCTKYGTFTDDRANDFANNIRVKCKDAFEFETIHTKSATSVWHNASEKSVKDIPILFHSTFDNKWYVFNYSKDINWNVVDKWAYVDELLKL